MEKQKMLEFLNKFGVIIKDSHIVYTSDKHGTDYVNKDAIYPHTRETSALCKMIAQQFADDSVEVVIAPAIGGVILSQWTAYHLSEMTDREVLGIYAEKVENSKKFVIKRGYDKLVPGKNVLVVEDILTTGASVKKVIEAVRSLGGNVIGLGVLCNRGGVVLSDTGNPPKLFSLINLNLSSWDEADCPLCAKNIPINKNVGKGK